MTEVAVSLGVSRQTVSGWKSRYEASGLASLADRWLAPCPHQDSAEAEAKQLRSTEGTPVVGSGSSCSVGKAAPLRWIGCCAGRGRLCRGMPPQRAASWGSSSGAED
nr:helix-turn-helix domain-containing protein [Streptomyces radiopugnans]